MQSITILDKQFLDINKYTFTKNQTLPKGYLYQSHEELNIFKILKSFSIEYQDIYAEIEKNINGFYIVDENSIWLDELAVTYGLPNIIFPTLSTNKEKALAINMMRYLKILNSVESYETFLYLLGFNVKFYLKNEVLIKHNTFQYSFPISFSNSITKKDKITYLVYTEPNQGVTTKINNIGSAFPIQFALNNDNAFFVKKILDFIKPDFILFQYITLETKNLYNIQ